MRKQILLFSLSILSFHLLNAQITIHGTVVSSTDGLPIAGVHISDQQSKTTTVTDPHGNFKLSLPSKPPTLLFQHIGMVPQEVQTKERMKVSLTEQTHKLDEFVITAMGIWREKNASGYSSQEISGIDLTRGENSDFITSLQGKVAGVEIKPSSGMPGASAQMVIRGARSFTENNTPLYVVDGLPINSTFDLSTGSGMTGSDYSNRSFDIDPQDIKSIHILKGQAAAALYGVRASNGVILITTRNGESKQNNRTTIRLHTSLSFDLPSRMPQLQTEYAQGSKGKFDPTNAKSWGPLIDDLPNDPIYGGNSTNAYNGGNTSLYPGKYYVPQRATAGLDPWVAPSSYDNAGTFFQTGHTYALSAHIGYNKEHSTLALTLGSTNQEGIIPSTGMYRYSGKLSASTHLSPLWKIGFTSNFTTSKINKTTTANDGLLAMVYPAPPSYDLRGIPNHNYYNPYEQNTYRSTGSFDDPYWSLQHNEHNERTDRFFGNTFIEYTQKWGMNHSLNLRYQLGVDSYTSHFIKLWGYGHANGKGSVNLEGLTFMSINSLLTAQYIWRINNKFRLEALAGNEFIHNGRKRYSQYGKDFNYSGWNHLNNTTVQSNEESLFFDRTVGFFASATLSYDNLLYLTTTGRNDYTSTMPIGKHGFFYPSVSLSFVPTEWASLRNEVISYAKIRASYAEVGQAGQYLDSYYVSPSYKGGFYSSYPPYMFPSNGIIAFEPSSVLYDPELKPQNTRSFEIGTDLQFWNNLFELSYTYARQNIQGQIFEIPLPASTGSTSCMMNGGKIHTNTHELTLNAHPVRSSNLDWTIGLRFTKTDNWVDELAPEVESIFLGGSSTQQVRAAIGEKFPTLYGNTYQRDGQGRILVDSRGLPMADKPGNLGTASPDFIVGANSSFRWKTFTLSALFDWKQGGVMYGGTAGLLNNYGVSRAAADARNEGIIFPGYYQDGTPNETVFQGTKAEEYFTQLNTIFEAYIYDASFLKLREVALHYEFIRNKRLRVGASLFARNLLLWTAYPSIDPESSQGNNNMGGAFERFSLPATSSYGMGVTFEF